MTDEPVHIVPGGRPALAAPPHPGRGRRKRARRRKAYTPFLPQHGVARPGLNGHGHVLRVAAARTEQASPLTPTLSPQVRGEGAQAHEPVAGADDVLAFLARTAAKAARGKK